MTTPRLQRLLLPASSEHYLKLRAVSMVLQRRGLKDRKTPGNDELTQTQHSGAQSQPYIPVRLRRRLEDKGIKIAGINLPDAAPASDGSKQNNEIETHLADALVNQQSSNMERMSEFPSDYVKTIDKDQTYPTIHQVPTEKLSVLLFPGQGSQFVGMGKNLLKYPGVEELYQKASAVLGYDLLKVCLNGPIDKLTQTLYCQPAVFVTSVAALEKMKEEHSEALENVVAAAGYSVGEFAAVVASGAMSFEDAIEIINLRALAMDTAAKQSNGGMLTVFLSQKAQLRTAIVAAKDYCQEKLHMENPVCNIAAYLTIGVRVVAGHEEALAFLQQYGKEFGIKRSKMLPVSGAFHTDLMAAGGPDYWRFVDRLEATELIPPKFPLFLNNEGKRFDLSQTSNWQLSFARILYKQIRRPIKWEQTIQNLFRRPKEVPFPKIYEVGPGKQLGVLLKLVNEKAYRNYRNIEV